MAYSLGKRFSSPPKYFPFYDPGTYQYEKSKLKLNTVGFLSKSPRITGGGIILWTHASYDGDVPHRIQNITSMKSKGKRFPYEAFSAEDLHEILCKCGLEDPCTCHASDDNEPRIEIVCQGKVKRRLFKGPGPRSILGDEGLSAPSRNDNGFHISTSGSQQRLRKNNDDKSPQFYDARVNESTAFYHGCKWSSRTSSRDQKLLESRPGPTDYNLEHMPTDDETCAQRVRAYKRKTSKQLRFIEIVQQQNIAEGRPGPATYYPVSPKGTNLHFIGPKAERFSKSTLLTHPGPADHWLRRDFDPVELPAKTCHAILPEPAFFGIKSKRFISQKEQGPSPATYDTNYKPCQYVHCPTTPFGSSAIRFKPLVIEENEVEEFMTHDEVSQEITTSRPTPTWEFKSKTVRMQPLVRMMNEPSPADLPQTKNIISRSPQLQYAAPFYSSDGRFRPWYNYIPVFANFKTPGPNAYHPDVPKCLPAFNCGPLSRARRFPINKFMTPAPNEYNIKDGIETILKTHNNRLADNIKKQPQFKWKPPVEVRSLSYRQREVLLLKKCIKMLEPEESASKKKKRPRFIQPSPDRSANPKSKPKMLRTFLYSHAI